MKAVFDSLLWAGNAEINTVAFFITEGLQGFYNRNDQCLQCHTREWRCLLVDVGFLWGYRNALD